MIGARLVPNALPPETLASLRALAAATPFQDYWIADRGKYRFHDSLDAPDVFAALLALVRETDPAARILQTRFTRHRHGDYAQPKDDDRFWAGRAAVDVTLDFSAASSDEAQVVWFDAARSLVLPQAPGTVAVVPRPAPVTRYERYLTHRLGGAEIFRLRLVVSAETRAA